MDLYPQVEIFIMKLLNFENPSAEAPEAGSGGGSSGTTFIGSGSDDVSINHQNLLLGDLKVTAGMIFLLVVRAMIFSGELLAMIL